MSKITQSSANDPLTGQSYKNKNESIYDIPRNIAVEQCIPRERENKLYQVGNIEFCYKCMKNDNKYCPVFTYTTTLKLKNGTSKKTVLNSYLCTIHDTEETFPENYSKQMFQNKLIQRKYEEFIEQRYFKSNSSSEMYKMIFENPLNLQIKDKEYSSGISSLQKLYDEIFDIDQELYLLFQKKKFLEKNSSKTSLSNIYNNKILLEDKSKEVQCIFKTLKMKNRSNFEYKGNLSTERIVYYKDSNVKTYDILRVPHVFEYITLGGILGKNDLVEFGKYLKNEVFIKRDRKFEFIKVNETKIQSNKYSKSITIIKYTMEDYPFMVSAIMDWIHNEKNSCKIIYPHW